MGRKEKLGQEWKQQAVSGALVSFVAGWDAILHVAYPFVSKDATTLDILVMNAFT